MERGHLAFFLGSEDSRGVYLVAEAGSQRSRSCVSGACLLLKKEASESPVYNTCRLGSGWVEPTSSWEEQDQSSLFLFWMEVLVAVVGFDELFGEQG